MIPRSFRYLPALAALVGWASPGLAQKWQMQYFYDKAKATFEIADLQFPSATRGLAVGNIAEGKHEKPVAVVTSDGGGHWQMLDLKDSPVSLFFLNESLGWMVTAHGLWKTTETGKSWEHVPGLSSGIFRVYFTDEQTGFAVGSKKTVQETHDGGKHWTPVAAAAEPPGVPKFSAYNWVTFVTPKYGLITGWNLPPRHSQDEEPLPDWVDPEGSMKRRDTPHLSYSLVTRDGGSTWKANSASLFGDVMRVRFGPNGVGLGLIEYSNAFYYPSEVYKIDWTTGKSETVYRDRKFAVSDIWLTPDGTAYLAGTAVTGQVRHVLPGRVQVLKSSDYSAWTEIPVDYRASANRTVLAVVDADNMWMATDNGMILKLVK